MVSATIDVSPLRGALPTDRAHERVVKAVAAACGESGFFCVEGHGIDDDIRSRLVARAREFFAQPDSEKARIAMPSGGRAWRGWFPLGGELTSGAPDAKEGIYFGTDLAADHPAVLARTPLHGPNLYPERPAELADLVETWMAELTDLGRLLLQSMALGLGLEQHFFDQWCADPLVMFRIFHYPARPTAPGIEHGVAQHTDYGLLTLLAQDSTGGLEVATPSGWEPVAPRPGVLVCNLGDMMERATGGRYRSTLHRVRRPDRDRISMPLFLDPNWNAVVEPIAAKADPPAHGPLRWDGLDPLDGLTRYGDYLGAKVSKVFPELFDSAIGDTHERSGRANGRSTGD